MSVRINYREFGAEGLKGFREVEVYLRKTGMDEKLRELIKLRVSQINGCAYCLDMHSKDAMKMGETVQRIIGLDAWREAPYYTEKERAALAWTEAVTLISGNDVSDELYEYVQEYFDEQELFNLNLAVIAINVWNRMAIPFRAEAGSYQPK